MRYLLPTVSALPLILLASPAFAQETLRGETVIVTVPGPERSADELIGNATVFDREDLLEELSSTLGDTLEGKPGVTTTFFGQGASRPVLRGLGAERVQVLTNGIGVIDVSAASPDHQVAADGIDAQKIEVLRGPAALTYGGQAIGGVVNVIDGLIVSELPDGDFSGDLFSGYNSVNDGLEQAGSAQFVGGPFVFNLSVSRRDFEDYDIPGFAESDLLMAMEEAEHDDDHDDDHDHEGEEEARDTLENSFLKTNTYAAGLSWVGERAFFGVAVRQQTSEYGLPGHSHEHGEEHGDDDHDDDDDHDHEEGEEEEGAFIDLEQTRIDLRGGVEFDGDVLTGLTGSLAIVDYEHAEFEGPGEIGTVYATDGFESRVELDHTLAGFNGALGLQYSDKDFEAVGEEAFITPTSSTSLGVFLYETKEWDSGFGIEAGARVETVERDNIEFGEADFDLFSGSFGAHQHLNGGWFVGGQLAYTERAPNESELFAFGAHIATEQFEVGNPNFSKESGLNLEGTARWESDIFSLGVNVFITEFTDFIYLTPGEAVVDGVLVDEADELPIFLFVQEDAQFYGAELYGEAVLDGPLGAEWEFNASLDLVEAELDSGGNVPFIPPMTLHTGASAEWGPWEVGADITVAAEQDDPGAGQLETDGYTQIDLRAEVDLSDFNIGTDGTEAFIEVRNAGDEEIRYATSVLKDTVPAPGRNVRVGVRLAF